MLTISLGGIQHGSFTFRCGLWNCFEFLPCGLAQLPSADGFDAAEKYLAWLDFGSAPRDPRHEGTKSSARKQKNVNTMLWMVVPRCFDLACVLQFSVDSVDRSMLNHLEITVSDSWTS